jgi:hypothetical protein
MSGQLVITIKVGTAEGREIKLKSGDKKKVADQIGFIEANDEVRKVRIPIDVEHGQTAYPPGRYTLAASSFGVGKFHYLEINRYEMALVPLVAASALKVG